MARTESYVDPAGGNDTTGDGSKGTPWKTVQKALDTATKNTTDGNRINIKAGGTDTLSAKLDFTTWSTTHYDYPLTFEGYTTDEGDGGIGVMSGGGSVSIMNDNKSGINWVNMDVGNCGGNVILKLGEFSAVVQCEVSNGTSHGIEFFDDESTICFGCHVHDIGGQGIRKCAHVSHCYFKNDGTSDFTYAISMIAAGNANVADHNIISIDGTSSGIRFEGAYGCSAVSNTILGGGSTGDGIAFANTNSTIEGSAFNNYIEGFSGAGGAAISFLQTLRGHGVVAYNAFFNNTTNLENVTGGAEAAFTGGDDPLASTGLDKSGADSFANRLTYFAPADVETMRSGGYHGEAFGAVPAPTGGGGGGGGVKLVGRGGLAG